MAQLVTSISIAGNQHLEWEAGKGHTHPQRAKEINKTDVQK